VTVRCFLGLWLVAIAVGFAAVVPARAAEAASHPADVGAVVEAAPDPGAHSPGAHSPDAHAGHGGHEHDPYDLGHGNAGPLMTNPIEWRYDLALASFAVFVVLFLLLSRFAWGSIRDGLDRREKAIVGRLEAAQQSADEAAEQLRLYQEKLAAAAQESQDLVNQARRTAEAAADAFRREAQEAAARERDRAIADIQAAKNVAVQEVAQRAADLALLLAGRIVRRELSPQDHAAMIAEALEQLPSQN
jgi:F-type H+-transporting ATPase subunit b